MVSLFVRSFFVVLLGNEPDKLNDTEVKRNKTATSGMFSTFFPSKSSVILQAIFLSMLQYQFCNRVF